MALWSEGKVEQSDSEGERVNDEEKEEDENEHNEDAGTGWAEAMANILGKKTTSGILEKNKELEKMKAAERREQLERKKQVSSESQVQMMKTLVTHTAQFPHLFITVDMK